MSESFSTAAVPESVGPGRLGLGTASGRFVPAGAATDDVLPAISDIAYALNRIVRFGGHGRVWWSVLDHSLLVERMARDLAADLSDFDTTRRQIRLAALLHDAHEALTSDVPTAFKPSEMAQVQRVIDARLMGAYYPGGVVAYRSFEEYVKRCDRRALLAEAMVVGPKLYNSPEAVEEFFGARPLSTDTARVVVALAARNSTIPGPLPASEETFIRLYAELR